MPHLYSFCCSYRNCSPLVMPPRAPPLLVLLLISQLFTACSATSCPTSTRSAAHIATVHHLDSDFFLHSFEQQKFRSKSKGDFACSNKTHSCPAFWLHGAESFPELVKKFPTFYWSLRYNTHSQVPANCSFSESDQSSPWLFSQQRLGFPSFLFSSAFPNKTICVPYLC